MDYINLTTSDMNDFNPTNENDLNTSSVISFGTESTNSPLQDGGFLNGLFANNKDKQILLAAKNNKEEAVIIIDNELIENYSTQDEDGNTLLHFVAQDFDLYNNKNSNLVDKIINYSSGSIDTQNNNGATPLVLAVKNNNNELATKLVAAGANKDIKTNDGYYVESDQENVTVDSASSVIESLDWGKTASPTCPFATNNSESDEKIIEDIVSSALSSQQPTIITINQPNPEDTIQSPTDNLPTNLDTASYLGLYDDDDEIDEKIGETNDPVTVSSMSMEDTEAFVDMLMKNYTVNNKQTGGKRQNIRLGQRKLVQYDGDINDDSDTISSEESSEDEIKVEKKKDKKTEKCDDTDSEETSSDEIFNIDQLPTDSEPEVNNLLEDSEDSNDSNDSDDSENNNLSTDSELSRMIKNQTSEIHDRVVDKIKELLKIDDIITIKAYKSLIYQGVKEDQPTLSGLDRAVEMEKRITKEKLKAVDKKELNNRIKLITEKQGEKEQRKDKKDKDDRVSAKQGLEEKPKEKKVSKKDSALSSTSSFLPADSELRTDTSFHAINHNFEQMSESSY